MEGVQGADLSHQDTGGCAVPLGHTRSSGPSALSKADTRSRSPIRSLTDSHTSFHACCGRPRVIGDSGYAIVQVALAGSYVPEGHNNAWMSQLITR